MGRVALFFVLKCKVEWRGKVEVQSRIVLYRFVYSSYIFGVFRGMKWPNGRGVRGMRHGFDPAPRPRGDVG